MRNNHIFMTARIDRKLFPARSVYPKLERSRDSASTASTAMILGAPARLGRPYTRATLGEVLRSRCIPRIVGTSRKHSVFREGPTANFERDVTGTIDS